MTRYCAAATRFHRDPFDFIVNEIDPQGNVVVLSDTTTTPPQPKLQATPPPQPPAADSAKAADVASAPADDADDAPPLRLTKEWLCEAVGPEPFAAVVAFAEATQPRERPGAAAHTSAGDAVASAGGEQEGTAAQVTTSTGDSSTGAKPAPDSVAVEFTRANADRQGFKPHAHAVIKVRSSTSALPALRLTYDVRVALLRWLVAAVRVAVARDSQPDGGRHVDGDGNG